MRIEDDLTCRDLVELVTEYLEGALPDGIAERFEQHLVLCDGCAAHVTQMRETIRLAGALREEDLGADQAADLLAAFRGWRVAT